MWQLRVRDHILATMSVLFVLLFSFAVADAKGPGQLPNVMVLATGGTIAGTGASSTTVVGYTAATVGIERLLNAVPELKTVANVKGEQVFQIASENMNNDYWLKLAKHVNALLAQDDVDGIVITHGTDTIEETSYFFEPCRQEQEACRHRRRDAAVDSDQRGWADQPLQRRDPRWQRRGDRPGRARCSQRSDQRGSRGNQDQHLDGRHLPHTGTRLSRLYAGKQTVLLSSIDAPAHGGLRI